MHKIFRQLTLSRIAAALFIATLALLITGLLGLIATSASDGAMMLGVHGLSAGETVLLGIASFVLAAVVLGLAVANERLVRVEAKLGALAQREKPEKQSSQDLAEPSPAADCLDSN
jgi:hypothetical protein